MIYVSCHFDFGENLKNSVSQKECFNKIWPMIGDKEYINIAEIEIDNFIPAGFLGAKHFSRTPQMLIYANKRENDGAI